MTSITQTLKLAQQRHQSGDLAEAQTLYREILTRQPDHPQALHLLGVLAQQTGHPEAAADLIRQSIRSAEVLGCPSGESYYNLGTVLIQLGQYEAAAIALQQAVTLRPAHARSHHNLGAAWEKLRRFDEAAACFRRVLGLAPDDADAHNSLGNVLLEQEQPAQAIAAYRRAIAARADHADAYNNMGTALRYQCQWDAAREAFTKAVGLNPNDPSAHVNLGGLNLLLGDLASGWPHYEWRWQLRDVQRKVDPTQPLWDGRPLEGRRILLHAEQGYGDTIQFVRYAPLVAARGGHVILLCQGKLTSLLQNSQGVESLTTLDQPLADFDVHCPLLSLPGIFQTTLENIPATIPYLRADPARKWNASGDGLKIGLSWAGNAGHHNDRNRSLALSVLAPLAGARPARFYSLQKGAAAAQGKSPPAGMDLSDLSEGINDFADTAAIVENLDLIITADTALAHLAGAMGKAVWVLLPFIPDWRWLLNRTDSPWYPTMRLFRQARRGDWDAPIAQMVDALRRG